LRVTDRLLQGGRFPEKLIAVLIEVRNKGRQRKSFVIADSIRSHLNDVGIILEDYRAGTLWRQE